MDFRGDLKVVLVIFECFYILKVNLDNLIDIIFKIGLKRNFVCNIISSIFFRRSKIRY